MRLFAVLSLVSIFPLRLQAACAVLPVCGGCSYTSIGAALAAAQPCDIIELQESRNEAVVLDQGLAEIRGTGSAVVWSSGSGNPTLEIRSGLNRALRIHSLTLRHHNINNERVILWSGLGAGASLEVDHAVLENASDGDGIDLNVNLVSAGQLWVHHNILRGMGNARNAVELASQSTADSVIIFNNLFYSWNRALEHNHNQPQRSILFYNNTVDSSATDGMRIQSRAYVRNNLFTGNLDDLTLGGSADLADFQYNAFEQAGEALNLATNLTGTSRALQYLAPGSDFHLRASADVRNRGEALPQVIDDLDGLARPLEGFHDMGCYEYNPAAPTPTATPSTTPTSAVEVSIEVRGPQGWVWSSGLCQSDHPIGDFSLSSDPYDPSKGPLALEDGTWCSFFNGLDDAGKPLPNGRYQVEVRSMSAGITSKASRPLTILSSSEEGLSLQLAPSLVLPQSPFCSVRWQPPVEAEVSFLDLSGALLKRAHVGPGLGRYDWDLRNAAGQAVASGPCLVAVRQADARRPRIAKAFLKR